MYLKVHLLKSNFQTIQAMDKIEYKVLRDWDVIGVRNRAIVEAFNSFEAVRKFKYMFKPQRVLDVIKLAPSEP